MKNRNTKINNRRYWVQNVTCEYVSLSLFLLIKCPNFDWVFLFLSFRTFHAFLSSICVISCWCWSQVSRLSCLKCELMCWPKLFLKWESMLTWQRTCVRGWLWPHKVTGPPGGVWVSESCSTMNHVFIYLLQHAAADPAYIHVDMNMQRWTFSLSLFNMFTVLSCRTDLILNMNKTYSALLNQINIRH